MKKKYLSETFLKDVREYDLKLFIKKDYFLCLKKIKKIEKPFYLKNGLCLIDDNYYVVEILYLDKHYSIRVFFNDRKEEILYYYDIIDKVGMDNRIMIPYYEDLYLDVIVKNNDVYILDEKEFENAFNDKKITVDQYNLAKNAMNNLISEIRQNKDIIKIDIRKLIEDN